MSYVVYKAEADIKTALYQAVTWASAVELCDKFELAPTKLKALFRANANTNGQIDLHYLKTILVSTVLNKNDDYFAREEVWAAKDTPEDKPFNEEHDCKKIIGHITSSYVIDDEGKTVANDCVIDDLPSKFHVVTGAVIYKTWRDAELQEHIDTLISEIAENKWFVSMECLFKGFDYVLLGSDKSMKVVARNEKTAFLTKHLRAYGGDGIYQDYKVGRLLRNIVFSGKGLVKKPANPESIIFAENQYAQGSQISGELGYSQITETKSREKMEQNLEQLQKTIAELQAKNTELQGQLHNVDVKKLTEAKDKAEADLKVVNEKVAALEASLTKKNDELKTSNEKFAKLETESKVVAEELATIKANQKKADRIAKVKAALKIDETKEDSVKAAVEMAEALSELSDEKFEAHLKSVAKFTPAPLPPTSTPAPVAPASTSAPAPMAGKASVDTSVLEKPAESAPTLAVSAQSETVREQIAAYFVKNKENGSK